MFDLPLIRLHRADRFFSQWLRTADSAMEKNQKQLMLIIDNVRMPMPGKPTVYEEVINAWTKALQLMENLISGTAQSPRTGEALLGLTAWHIYPDLCVEGRETSHVIQNDELVEKGGIATIGLSDSRDKDFDGIAWSMSLAHLRYYGKPIVSQTTLASSSSSVQFSRIVQVAIGSLISTWPNVDVDFEKILEFLVALGDFSASITLLPDFRMNRSWPMVLSQEARSYFSARKVERDEITRYIKLGQRRYHTFITPRGMCPPPFFGLSDPNTFAALLRPGMRVEAMRKMADLFEDKSDLDVAIIRYVYGGDSFSHGLVAFASLRPQSLPGARTTSHRRWLVLTSDLYSVESREVIEHSIEIMTTFQEPCSFIPQQSLIESTDAFSVSFNGSYPIRFSYSDIIDITSLEYYKYLKERNFRLPWVDLFFATRKSILSHWSPSHVQCAHSRIMYTFPTGRTKKTAVLYNEPSPNHRASVDYLKIAIASAYLEAKRFVPYINDSSLEITSLIALANAHEIYQTLPEAEVDLSVASRPLCEAKWSVIRQLSRTIALACVTMFDTGSLDIDPLDLDQVIAISSANKIYAIESLFSDPYRPPPAHILRQVIGNLGKSGVSLLLSPQDTIVREPDLETWRSVNHVRFDGKFEDNFASTSLHLSLTGYEQALNIQNHGKKDNEASYLEAVLSVHDSGIWVADINILRFLSPSYEHQRIPSAPCVHTRYEKVNALARTDLSSVDNWYEYLDPPLNSGIIRASGNWIARLALATAEPPRNKGLSVCPDEICLVCLEDDLKCYHDRYPENGLILC